jgi:hypothetical protein
VNTQKDCESCGMPIDSGQYCQYCLDETGELQSFEKRFEAMVSWQQRRDPASSREAAEEATRTYMRTMPAWREHPALSPNIDP